MMSMKLALALMGLGLVALHAFAADERPNILFAIGDNWLYDHAGANGDPAVKTPVFDRIAKEGARFTRAFCPVPSCSPTRSSLLTGRAAHQLEDAANLWSIWPAKFRVFTDALRDSGYQIGYTGKGWSPGNHKDYGREENPAGPLFEDFTEFLDGSKPGKPFFFWLGDTNTPLNKWKAGAHEKAGIDPAKVRVPAYLPDTPEVRADIADYLEAVERVDAAVGAAVAELEKRGLMQNTIIVYTSDNGWQMPHGLANCYDAGSHIPLAIRWAHKVQPGRVIDAFVSLTDFAPTFLELAGMIPWSEMTGRSFVDLLVNPNASMEGRDQVFLERERHANVRRGDLSYPIRSVRTKDFLYVRNLRPDRWPAGDPEVYMSVGDFGDIDGSATKEFILAHKEELAIHPFYVLNFEKRPGEELYDLAKDPDQVHNVAADPAYTAALKQLSGEVDRWMRETQDPRVDPNCDAWDRYPYFGGVAKKLREREKKSAVKPASARS